MQRTFPFYCQLSDSEYREDETIFDSFCSGLPNKRRWFIQYVCVFNEEKLTGSGAILYLDVIWFLVLFMNVIFPLTNGNLCYCGNDLLITNKILLPLSVCSPLLADGGYHHWLLSKAAAAPSNLRKWRQKSNISAAEAQQQNMLLSLFAAASDADQQASCGCFDWHLQIESVLCWHDYWIQMCNILWLLQDIYISATWHTDCVDRLSEESSFAIYTYCFNPLLKINCSTETALYNKNLTKCCQELQFHKWKVDILCFISRIVQWNGHILFLWEFHNDLNH